jgi:hypothetical protein
MKLLRRCAFCWKKVDENAIRHRKKLFCNNECLANLKKDYCQDCLTVKKAVGKSSCSACLESIKLRVRRFREREKNRKVVRHSIIN